MDQAQSLRDIMNRRKDSAVQAITVTSAKGGVGKSSISLNLAIALNRRGSRTLLVDMDLGLANIDLMLGVKTRYSLADVLSGQKQITEIIETGVQGVQFISGGSGISELMNMPSQHMHRIITHLLNLREVADVIIFDTGSGISDYIIRLVCASHATFLVTTPEPTAIMDAYALVKQVNNEKARPNIQLILNKAETEKEAITALNGFIQIAEKYTDVQISSLGYIMRDQHMVMAVKKQSPLLELYPACTAAQNIEALADKYLQCATTGKTGFYSFLERLFGKTINN